MRQAAYAVERGGRRAQACWVFVEDLNRQGPSPVERAFPWLWQLCCGLHNSDDRMDVALGGERSGRETPGQENTRVEDKHRARKLRKAAAAATTGKPS